MSGNSTIVGASLSNKDTAKKRALVQVSQASKRGRTYSSQFMSPDQVRSEAANRAKSIFENFATLNAMLMRHESTIRKRWRKKTESQRLKVLHHGWGGLMPAKHRPDIKAILKRKHAHGEADVQLREACMWPQINQEDLLKPKNLLLLINARGRHSPFIFAGADLESVQLGMIYEVICPVILSRHVMLFRGIIEPSSYGGLLHWNDCPGAAFWQAVRGNFPPGDGLLILELQERIMSFLVKCVEYILADLPEELLLRGLCQPEPPSLLENEHEFASLTTLADEAPYRLPSQLSFRNLKSLLRAKMDQAADHIWALREEPSYFEHHMRDVYEHQREMITDSHGQIHSLLEKSSGNILWGQMLSNEIAYSYTQFEMWSKLHEQALQLERLQSTYESVITYEEDLPAAYLDAILTFLCWLQQFTKRNIHKANFAIAASSPWRHYFVRKPDTSARDTQISVELKANKELNDDRMQFLLLMQTHRQNEEALNPNCIINYMTDIQRLVDSTAQTTPMLSLYTAGLVADISITAHCIRETYLYTPWSCTFDMDMQDEKSRIIQDFIKQTATIMRLDPNRTKKSYRLLASFGDPNKVDFRFPAHKRQSSANTDAMRMAEANLDRFWAHYDTDLRQTIGGLRGTALWQLLRETRKVKRTPEWKEPDQCVPNQGKADGTSKSSTICVPLSEMYFDLQQRTEETIQEQAIHHSSSTRIKTKTRKHVGAQHDAENVQTSALQLCESTTRVIVVNTRALKVFKTIFFTESPEATPGEVRWTDFLHAMRSAGLEPRRLQGSLWHFEHIVNSHERSIIFHEPHPVAKIPYIVARQMGRRLNRAYGWSASTFVSSKDA